MYYYKNRIYSPTLGRFLQTDPIGTAGGINLYAYVGNDPVNATDPLGLACGLIQIGTQTTTRFHDANGNGRVDPDEKIFSVEKAPIFGLGGGACGSSSAVNGSGPSTAGGSTTPQPPKPKPPPPPPPPKPPTPLICSLPSPATYDFVAKYEFILSGGAAYAKSNPWSIFWFAHAVKDTAMADLLRASGC